MFFFLTTCGDEDSNHKPIGHWYTLDASWAMLMLAWIWFFKKEKKWFNLNKILFKLLLSLVFVIYETFLVDGKESYKDLCPKCQVESSGAKQISCEPQRSSHGGDSWLNSIGYKINFFVFLKNK